MKLHYMQETPKSLVPLHWNSNKDITMDNLQETSIYLAGLLDGEGYVQLTKHERANNKVRLLAAISYSNTDARIIDILRVSLDRLDIPFHVYTSTRNFKKGGKIDYTINISRLTAVKRVLEVVLESPFLGKRTECEALLEFVNGRLGPNGIPWPRGGTGQVRSVPYTENDWSLYRVVNSYGCHKMATPQRAYVKQPLAEDVLCSEAKASEVAEMTARANKASTSNSQ